MRRNTGLGMAVLAVLALCAVTASAAFAAEPELIRAGKKGEAVKGAITGKSKGSTTLETAGGTKVTCTSATSSGGTTSGTKEPLKETKGTKIAFKGCKESVLNTACKTSGDAAEEITTVAIDTKIGYVSNPTTKKTEVGLEFLPEGTTEALKATFTKFECTGGFTKIEAIGAVIGLFGKEQHKKSTKSLNLVFGKGEKAGTQEILGITGGFMTEAHLESNVNKGTFEKSNQQGEGTVEFEEAVELNA